MICFNYSTLLIRWIFFSDFLHQSDWPTFNLPELCFGTNHSESGRYFELTYWKCPLHNVCMFFLLKKPLVKSTKFDWELNVEYLRVDVGLTTQLIKCFSISHKRTFWPHSFRGQKITSCKTSRRAQGSG